MCHCYDSPVHHLQDSNTNPPTSPKGSNRLRRTLQQQDEQQVFDVTIFIALQYLDDSNALLLTADQDNEAISHFCMSVNTQVSTRGIDVSVLL